MKPENIGKKNSKKNAKKQLNKDEFKALLANNKEMMIAHTFNEAVQLALIAKYGSGLISHDKLSNSENIESMKLAMAPLKDFLEYEATASFARVFDGILSNFDLREYFLSKTSKIQGKRGGRSKGYKAPHIEWLERALISQVKSSNDYIKPMSAKEHFRNLKHRHEIRGEDDKGNLVFTDDALNEFNYDDEDKYVITLNAVQEANTRIRKSK